MEVRKRPQLAVKRRKGRNHFVKTREVALRILMNALDLRTTMKIDALRKKHALGVGFVAVLVPLLVLLGLQYRWLVKLEHSSKIVQKATLETFLEGVTGEVERFYGSYAERMLDLPPPVFTQNQLY